MAVFGLSRFQLRYFHSIPTEKVFRLDHPVGNLFNEESNLVSVYFLGGRLKLSRVLEEKKSYSVLFTVYHDAYVLAFLSNAICDNITIDANGLCLIWNLVLKN